MADNTTIMSLDWLSLVPAKVGRTAAQHSTHTVVLFCLHTCRTPLVQLFRLAALVPLFFVAVIFQLTKYAMINMISSVIMGARPCRHSSRVWQWCGVVCWCWCGRNVAGWCVDTRLAGLHSQVVARLASPVCPPRRAWRTAGRATPEKWQVTITTGTNMFQSVPSMVMLSVLSWTSILVVEDPVFLFVERLPSLCTGSVLCSSTRAVRSL